MTMMKVACGNLATPPRHDETMTYQTDHRPTSPLAATAVAQPDRRGELIIDCDHCVMRRTNVCNDCVVTFLIERDHEGAVVLDFAEVRAMKMLAEAGLVPSLRHRGHG
jgi:hypothetical protein